MRLRAPIVLVHGLFGFSRLCVGNWVVADYFRGIPADLQAAGNRVFLAQLSPTGGIAARARQLREFIDRNSPTEPVHILAHSMGGLDARYMIARENMASRVLTLTTLGTPHRGCTFADWSLTRLVRLFVPLFDHLELPRQAFHDLTVSSCRRFNEEILDAPSVRYFSVGGLFRSRWFDPSWSLPASIVERAEGPCDGLVSLASARWGESFEVWQGDHMNLVNWRHLYAPSSQHDRRFEYAALVERLRDEGF